MRNPGGASLDRSSSRPPSVFRSELPLWAGAITTALFLVFGDSWLADLSSIPWFSFLFLWLFAVLLWLSFSVVRHADCLAVLLGEPYGTLILTFSVISIEVLMIAAIMLSGDPHPTVARDTMFAVLMIVLNGMVGVTLLSFTLSLRQSDVLLAIIATAGGLGTPFILFEGPASILWLVVYTSAIVACAIAIFFDRGWSRYCSASSFAVPTASSHCCLF